MSEENFSFNQSNSHDETDSIKSGASNPLMCITKVNIIEFNRSFASFKQNESETSIDKMNRSLALLASSVNPSSLNIDCPDTVNFFMNLYSLMTYVDAKSVLLWSALAFLGQIAKNSRLRPFLLYKMRFMQIFADLLKSGGFSDRILNILHLLETMSYDIRITWQEPYLAGLIRTLVDIIDGQEDDLCELSFSVLVNLCYNNVPAIYILLKAINTDEFLERNKKYGILAFKMRVILDASDRDITPEETENFVRTTLSEMKNSLMVSNYGALHHLIAFYEDTNRDIGYKKLSGDTSLYFINGLMDLIDELMRIYENKPFLNTAKEINDQDWAKCVSKTLDFFKHLLSSVLETDDNTLFTKCSDFAKCALKWLDVEQISVTALQLLSTIIEINVDFVSGIHGEIALRMSDMIFLLENVGIDSEQVFCLLKLILKILQKNSLPRDDAKTVTNFIIFQIFGWESEDMDDEDIKCRFSLSEMDAKLNVLALMVLKELDNKFFGLENHLERLLQNKCIQLSLAKAIRSDDQEICSDVFILSRSPNFPVREISRIIADESKSLSMTEAIKKDNTIQQSDSESIFNNGVSYASQKRLDDLIKMLSDTFNNKELIVSDVMELFELRIAIYNREEKELLARLDSCNNEVTKLSQSNELMSAELNYRQTQNLMLQMSTDRFKGENSAIRSENSSLVKTIERYKNVIINEKAKQKAIKEELENMAIEIQKFKDHKKDLINQNKTKDKQIYQLGQLLCDQLPKVKALEEMTEALIKEENKLHEQFVENSALLKFKDKHIKKLTKQNFKIIRKLKELDRTLQDKNRLLANYVHNLENAEKMRHLVASIIQNQNEYFNIED